MLDVSATFRRALGGPHTPVTRVELWSSGVQVDELEFLGGSVRCTLASRVTRVADLTLPARYMPQTTSDPLTPFGPELRIWRGLQLGAVTEELGVFRGRLQSVWQNDDGTVSANAIDRAGDIVDSNFETPYSVFSGAFVYDSVKQLILDAQPDAEFGEFDVPNAEVPDLSWESSRAGALDDLAAGVGGLWYALADGSYVLRKTPWTTDAEPALALSDGDGGTILRSRWGYDRSGVYNSVTVLGERSDGSSPIAYTARDTNAASATYFQGPFGLRSTQHRTQAARDAGQAKLIGDTLLRRSLALSESWAVTVVADPSMELGDVVTINAKGRTARQVVVGFTMPLLGDEMPLDLRAQKPEGEAALV